MKVAFAFLEDRIAPVFDTAQRILLVEVDAGAIRSETIARLTAQEPMDRAKALARLEVDVLVCGAISIDLQQFLVAQEVRVMPFVAGDLKEIKAAWLHGTLEQGGHHMPGCRRYGAFRQEGSSMNKARRGRGCKLSQDSERGSSRSGPAGSTRGRDVCLCPVCGHREPHEHRTPCNSRPCPECGAAMTRECPHF